MLKGKIIAAIPCFNTEPFIGDVVSRAKKYVDEVIVVNDGSTDNTTRVAQAAGADVIEHKARKGAGAATKSGFEEAMRRKADIIVTLDGDGQHNPDEIPKLVSPILSKEADIVIGSRFLPLPQLSPSGSQQTVMPRYRRFGINVITLLCNFGFRVKISDSQSCFRAHSRKLVNAMHITEDGFSFSVEVLFQARKMGFVITEVPIFCLYHSHGSTANPVVHGLGVAFTVVKLRLRYVFRDLAHDNNRGSREGM
jgi:glycosyltransferase involved in cell wall biosynthesis